MKWWGSVVMQNRNSQQFQRGLGVITFKSLKRRNCPATVRVEHVISIYFGMVNCPHPFSSESSPFSFGNHSYRDKSIGKNCQDYCEGVMCNNYKLSALYELEIHRHLLMSINIWRYLIVFRSFMWLIRLFLLQTASNRRQHFFVM